METSSPTPFLAPVEDGADFPAYRTQPSNIEAEQALLGAILVNNDCAATVSGFLTAEHFFEPIHQRIYETAQNLIERGHIANPTTLKAYFDGDDALAEIGGAEYLRRLAAGAITIINAEDYGRTIYDLSLRRQLVVIGEDMVNTAYSSTVEETAVLQIEASEQRLYNLAETGKYEGGFQSIKDSLTLAVASAAAALKRDSHLSGVTTGFTDLDAILGGLHKSDLIILAGRPSMGKTALATNIAFNAAEAHRADQDDDGDLSSSEGAVVAFFSLEMSAEQLALRLLAEQTGISSQKIRRGRFSTSDFDRIVDASRTIETLGFFIDDTPAISIATLRARARRLKRQHNLGLIVVDYLQLLRPAHSGRSENRVLEISEITQGLKALAKELEVPVLALSQLSRAVELRDDKRPQLADLRESGAIEQDADVVLFIYREEYYWLRTHPRPVRKEGVSERDFELNMKQWEADLDQDGSRGITEVIIGKHRNGPTDTIQLLFEGRVTKFANYIKSDRLPDEPF
jgi:replicative DNA helicase